MTYFKYIILSIIQGITEPLPISSSGHLFLLKSIFNIKITDLSFEIITNFGSFLAILFLFRKEEFKIIKGLIKKNKKDYQYLLKLIISTIPIGIIGLLFKESIENKLNNIKLLGLAFFITFLMLLLIRNKDGFKQDNDITYKDAFFIGIAQCIAIIPGISRSGIVLTCALLCNFKKSTALKYTFFMYLPVSIASFILELLSLSFDMINILYISIAFLFTLLSFDWLTNIIKRKKLIYFAFYALFLSVFIFIYFR